MKVVVLLVVMVIASTGTVLTQGLIGQPCQEDPTGGMVICRPIGGAAGAPSCCDRYSNTCVRLTQGTDFKGYCTTNRDG